MLTLALLDADDASVDDSLQLDSRCYIYIYIYMSVHTGGLGSHLLQIVYSIFLQMIIDQSILCNIYL